MSMSGLESELLNPDGSLKLLRWGDYSRFDPMLLRLFCHENARYLLPTVELVALLQDLIGGRSAIEIGSGTGDLGRALDIHMADNHCQEWPDVRELYQATGQPTIKYGKDVERLDAIEAIEKYKPEVVIGAWVTNWIDPELTPPPGGGSIFGVRESEVIKMVDTYIVIGAEAIHKYKPIMNMPHRVFNMDKVVRSRRQDNMLWIWGKQ